MRQPSPIPPPALRTLAAALCLALCAGCGSDATSPDSLGSAPGAEGSHAEVPGQGADGLSTGVIPDSDGDGLDDAAEAQLGTSPFLVDTDGDGYTDSEELLEFGFDPEANPFRFNPRIADVPRLEVEVVSEPDVFLTFSTSDSSSHSFDNTSSDTVSEGFNTSVTNSQSLRTETSNTVGGEASYGTMSGVSANYSHSWSESRETSFSWTGGRSTENSRTLSESRGFSESQDVTNSGCRVEVVVNIRNTGNIAFTLQTMSLGMRKIDPRTDKLMEVGQLEPESDRTFHDVTSLAPGESIEGIVFRAELPLAKAELLLHDGPMTVRPVMYEMLDSNRESFDHRYTAINARTSTITIDRGPGTVPYSYEVASYGATNPESGGRGGATLEAVLRDVMRLPFETGTTLWRSANDVEQTQPCLLSLDGMKTDSALGGYWLVQLDTDSGGATGSSTQVIRPLASPLDLASIQLAPTLAVRLVHVVDADRDGLGLRAEATLGLDPNAFDTDGDGHGDGDELLAGTNPRLGLATAKLFEAAGSGTDLNLLLSALSSETGNLRGISIDWGDGSPPQFEPMVNDQIIEVAHAYAELGDYAVRVNPVETSSSHAGDAPDAAAAQVRGDGALVRLESPFLPRWERIMEPSLPTPSQSRATSQGLFLLSEVRGAKRLTTYTISCVDLGGELRWSREIGAHARGEMAWWDGNFSLIDTDEQGRIYVTDHHRLLALDHAGETLWEVKDSILTLGAGREGEVYYAQGKNNQAEPFVRVDAGRQTWVQRGGLPKYELSIGMCISDRGHLVHSSSDQRGFAIPSMHDHVTYRDRDGHLLDVRYNSALESTVFAIPGPGGGVVVAGFMGHTYSQTRRAGIARYGPGGDLLWSEVAPPGPEDSSVAQLVRVPWGSGSVGRAPTDRLAVLTSYTLGERFKPQDERVVLSLLDDATGERLLTKTIAEYRAGDPRIRKTLAAGTDGVLYVTEAGKDVPCRITAWTLNPELTRIIERN